jgi:hypothetical protein
MKEVTDELKMQITVYLVRLRSADYLDFYPMAFDLTQWRIVWFAFHP